MPFIGRLKAIEYAMRFSLLIIYYLLSYFGSKLEVQDLLDPDLKLDLEPYPKPDLGPLV